jgi:hypothetical protein
MHLLLLPLLCIHDVSYHDCPMSVSDCTLQSDIVRLNINNRASLLLFLTADRSDH